MPLQALKAAAREGDEAALETIRGMFEREYGHKAAAAPQNPDSAHEPEEPGKI